MKGPLLSAWIAAGLVLGASGARAQQADCDLVCRLQSYLSTDHMAASAAGAASSSVAPVKHHATKAPKAGAKVATGPEPTTAAKAPSKHPVKAAAKAPVKTAAAVEPPAAPEPDRPRAAAIAKPKPSTRPKSVAQATHPTNRDPGTVEPPKQVAAIAAPVDPRSGPPALAPSRRPRRNASAVARTVYEPAPHPMASADLIPGSARLVPAEFQTFGNL